MTFTPAITPTTTPGLTGAGRGAEDPPREANATGTGRLLVCGAIGGPLFVVVVVVQALTRAGFSLTRNAASLLDDGPWGWVQTANFVVTGVLFIATATGLRRAMRVGRGSTWAPRLLLITGVGLVGGGLFHPDPSGGYPPGTSVHASAVASWHGVLHQVFGSGAFLALIVFCIVFARRYRGLEQRRLAVCSLLAGVLCAAGVASAGMPHGTLTLFIGVCVALLWAGYASAWHATTDN